MANSIALKADGRKITKIVNILYSVTRLTGKTVNIEKKFKRYLSLSIGEQNNV